MIIYKIHEKFRSLKVKIIKKFCNINSCPNCNYSGKSLWFVHQLFANTWYIECPKCHWCGKDSKFMLSALNKWNRGYK